MPGEQMTLLSVLDWLFTFAFDSVLNRHCLSFTLFPPLSLCQFVFCFCFSLLASVFLFGQFCFISVSERLSQDAEYVIIFIALLKCTEDFSLAVKLALGINLADSF